MKNNQTIIMIVIAVVFAIGGFFAGLKYQQSKTPTFAGRFNSQNGQGFARNGEPNSSNTIRQGFSPVNGEIIATDDKSITVKLPDGSSKIVLLSETADINKAETGNITDLTVGTHVAVFGSTNSDGSITAQNVQINPVFRDFSNPNVSP